VILPPKRPADNCRGVASALHLRPGGRLAGRAGGVMHARPVPLRVALAEPSTGILQMGGHARSGASCIPRPVKILPGVPYPGHPSPPAAVRHRSRGSVRPGRLCRRGCRTVTIRRLGARFPEPVDHLRWSRPDAPMPRLHRCDRADVHQQSQNALIADECGWAARSRWQRHDLREQGNMTPAGANGGGRVKFLSGNSVGSGARRS
jgi:hypothetical protein